MSQISFVPTSEWSEELRTFVAADSATELELGITRMLAHAPELAMGLLGFGGAKTTKRTLPERLIELLRLRVAFHNQCRSCMAIRYRAANADISEAVKKLIWLTITCSLVQGFTDIKLTSAVCKPPTPG